MTEPTGRAAQVVVVGGGIAGLAAAYELTTRLPGVAVTVLEGAERVGGKLRLGEVAGRQVDLGAEAVLNRRPEGVDLARRVGLADDVDYAVTTSAGVWSRGEVRLLPRTVMGVPADLEALAASGVVGRRAVARARLDALLPAYDASEDVAVGVLVGRRMGGDVRDRLVEPLLGGVYAGRADELSLHATVPQLVPPLREHGRLLPAARALLDSAPAAAPGTRAPVFAGIRGGVARLAAATEAAIAAAGVHVRCGTTVRGLSRTDTGFRLVCGPTIAPEGVDADAVIIAVPAAPAARLLREAAPRASVDLGQIRYASMAIVTVAFQEPDMPETLTGSGFLVPPVEGRTIKAVTYSSRKWGWLGDDLAVIRCSIGRIGEEPLLQRDDAELVSEAVMDLRDAVGVRARLVDAVVTRWGGALPQYAVGHLDRVRRVRAAVAAVPGLAVCGAAYDGVGIPACIATALDAAAQVSDHLRERGRLGS